MWKFGGTLLHNAVVHMFNTILKYGVYSQKWKLSIVTPIHKSLDIDNLSNYRGVAVADLISKIFCKVINVRIVRYLQEKGFWSPNQNGFMPKRQTDDNVMVLQTLFHKYVVKKKRQLYVAFVEFKNLFDSLNRSALYYKPLIKCGITRQVYNIIKSVYTGSSYCIKNQYGITENFLSNSGVTQGCTMSLTLSNLFPNDLHQSFNKSCNPVELDGTTLNSVSWADDLFMLVTSRKGLQCSLEKLKEYCVK